MRVGVLQFSPLFGNTKKNLDTVDHYLGGAEVDLLVMPELFSTGYQFLSREELLEYAEEVPHGLACGFLEERARALNGVIVAGLAERDGEKVYNTAVAIGPEGLIHRYRKVHLFREEKAIFDPGDEPFEVFKYRDVTVGVLVCFDWVFPEAARTLALKGADILCLPANLVLTFCQKTMVVRAIENRMFTVVANRTGSEARGSKEPLAFTGRSQIVHPSGDVLVSLGSEKQGLEIAIIDPADARNKRITPENDVFMDRRPDLYWR